MSYCKTAETLEHLVALLLVGRDVEFRTHGGNVTGRVVGVSRYFGLEVRVGGEREEYVAIDLVDRVVPLAAPGEG